MRKKATTFKLADKNIRWLKRNGWPMAEQLRRDLEMLRTLYRYCSDEGLTDENLGKMLMMAEREARD